MNNILNFKTILKYLLIFIGTYFLSYLGYLFPIYGQFLFWIIILVCFYLIRKDLSCGVLMVMAELFIGAKGYLFSFTIFDFVISIRLALFILVFLAWLVSKFKNREFKFISTNFFLPFAFFTLWLGIGIVTALANGNYLQNIFFDVNGYMYFAFAFVVFDTLLNKEALAKLINILVASGLAISLLIIYIFFNFTIFHQDSRPDLAEAISTEKTIEEEKDEEAGKKISHSITASFNLQTFDLVRYSLNQKPMIYRWSQDTAIAEISYLAGPFFRVFSSGLLYALILFLLVITFFFKRKKIIFNKNTYLLFIFGVVSLFALIISFSRSLWLGIFAGVIFILFNLPLKRFIKFTATILLLVILLSSLVYFITPSTFNIIGDRVNTIIHPSEESSGTNRLNILSPALDKISEHPLVGSGFGTTIIYESVTPEKMGTLRVFAYEWSYLDTITEIGIIGLALYFWLLLKIITVGYKSIRRLSITKENNEAILLIYSFITSIFAIIIANITTPYLNHPLGIGFLLVAMVVFYYFKTFNHGQQ